MANLDVNIKLLTLNVQGFRNRKTRQALFRSFRSSKIDVVALQDTHLTDDDIDTIRNEWNGQFHLSAGTKWRKGLLTLFNNSLSNYECNIVQKSERIMTSSIKFNSNSTFFVTNVYSPCDTINNRIDFLDIIKNTLFALYDEFDLDPSMSVILGDFNACLNNNLDIINGNSHPKSLVLKFNDIINQLNVHDIFRITYPSRKDFTWSKKENTVLKACRRLDYIFTTDTLLPFVNNIDIKTFGFSDHRGVLMHLDFRTFQRGPSTYKLNTDILKDIEFINMVKTELEKLSHLSKDLDPCMYWECIKAQIRSLGIIYSRSKSSHNQCKRQVLEGKLSRLEKQFIENPNDTDIESQIIKTKSELEIFCLAETRGAQIRAGIKFSELGEKCNKFFLGLEKCRATNNTIYRINDENITLTNSHDILNYISKYYKHIYKSPPQKPGSATNDADSPFLNRNNVYVLNDDERENSDFLLSESEILAALKSTKGGSAPGLDGLPVEVYKVFWHDIKYPLTNCFIKSFQNGYLSPSQSQALLCLLHKGGENPRESISSWRPISLLNADYKLIAKVLCMRLNAVINKLIDSSQFAFIKGRNISNMLRELYDIIENEKAANSNTILLSIDYTKAFDTLSTGAILKALKLYGFGEYFLNCIKTILSNRTCCVRNGGYISDEFEMERGVRQGCPISPVLFILTSELFAASVRSDPTIKGIKLYNSNRYVKILQYADDITLLLKDLIDFREILSKIKLFAEFSGLHLNITKTVAMKLGGDPWIGRSVYDIQFVHKIKLLGIYFSSSEDARLIPENTESKIKNLERICSLWSRRILTIQGKILILKVYGLSLFVNVIQSIGLTEKSVKRINRIFFRFIWSKNYSEKKVVERVKRSVLCNSKEEGGLGMIDLECFQQSFLLRWAEKLLDQGDADWKYAALKSLDKVGGISAFRSTLTSKAFKGLHLINNSFWKEVLKIWLDKRHPIEVQPRFSYESPLFNNPCIQLKNSTLFFPVLISRRILYVKDMLVNDSIISFDSFREIVDTPGCFLMYNCIYNALYPKLNTLNVDELDNPVNDIADHLKFRDYEIGSIGRKHFYNILNPPATPLGEWYWSRKMNNEFSKGLWLLPFISTHEVRLQTLQWKILMNIYPTASILSKMKIKPTDKCDVCKSIETIDHFFFLCAKRRKLWEYVNNILLSLFSRRIVITWEKAVLGILSEHGLNKKEIKLINLILLIAKLVISKTEYGVRQDPCILMENELRLRKILP